MKKLIFIFAALFMLVLISGCGARQNTIRYDNENDSANILDATDEDTEEVDNESEDVTEESDVENDVESESEDVTEIESEESLDDTVASTAESNPTGKLAVTSFDGAFLETKLSYNVVKGTVSSDTYKITINDYKLSKYIPGQTQWDYIASTKFNTLKSGLNSYVLKTFDKDGKQTDSLIFSIDYDAPVVPVALPDVGSNHWLALLAAMILSASYAVFRRYRWL